MTEKVKVILNRGRYTDGSHHYVVFDSVTMREVDLQTGVPFGPNLINEINPINERMFWGPELLKDGKFIDNPDCDMSQFDWPNEEDEK